MSNLPENAERQSDVEAREPGFRSIMCPNCDKAAFAKAGDYICLDCRGEEATDPVYDRLKAAEDVCWALLLLMHIGEMKIPQSDREFLGDPMQKWADLAASTGVLKDDEPVEDQAAEAGVEVDQAQDTSE